MSHGEQTQSSRPAVTFEPLMPNHAANLLEFELANREWFEQFIEPRPATFYSDQGISAHLAECARATSAGEMYPVLGCIGPRVVGRFNLRHIDTAQCTAQLGYRLDQSCVGRGWATLGVRHLLCVATVKLGLRSLGANVLANNPASERVLVKCGFKTTGQEGAWVTVNGVPYRNFEWRWECGQ